MGKRMEAGLVSTAQRQAIGRTAIVALLADEALTDLMLRRGPWPVHAAASEGNGQAPPRLERALQSIFALQGHRAADIRLSPLPDGHSVEFLLQPVRHAPEAPGEAARVRIDIHHRQPPCPGADRSVIHMHAPLLRVCAKLRSICQQMPAYRRLIPGAGPGTPRAADFVGIEALLRSSDPALETASARQMLELAFFARCVPLELLSGLRLTRDFHEPGFAQLRAAAGPGAALRDFGHYFDGAVDAARRLTGPGLG